MADNVQLPVPSTTGQVVATDDVAGVQFQRVKLTLGADGVNDGDVSSSNPVPVSITGSIPVTIASAIEITNDAGNAIPISASSLPLPTGAATETTLADINSIFKAEDTAHVSGDKGVPILAIRASSDSVTTDADGDYTNLKIDEEGRLKVSAKPASYPDITGDITAVQATIGTPVAGGTVSGDVSRASNVMAFCTGTFSTVNCTFEGSIEATGDTNWFGIQAVRTNANTIETATGNLSAQPAYGWEMSVNALKRVRVRATARTSGTQSWRFVQGTYATEPIPAAQVSATQPVSGTVTATGGASTARTGFIASSAIWYDDSATVLAGTATFTGTSRDLTVTATATTMANAATYVKELRVSAESDQSGTLWLEVSRDNTNWRRAKSVATAAVTGGGQYAEIVHRPSWRYARVGFTNGATLQTRFSIGSMLVAV